MKKIKAVALLLALISLLFTACRQPETFEPAPIETTTKAVTEAKTYVYSEYKTFNTQMGMSVEETQQAVKQTINLYLGNNGQYYFTLNKKGLDFIADKEKDIPVYFIFDGDYRLCEIQYEASISEGFDLEAAIKNYDSKYEKHIVMQKSSGNTNYVWYCDGVYILITTTPSDRVAMSFIGEEFFKLNNAEEYKEYNKK